MADPTKKEVSVIYVSSLEVDATVYANQDIPWEENGFTYGELKVHRKFIALVNTDMSQLFVAIGPIYGAFEYYHRDILDMLLSSQYFESCGVNSDDLEVSGGGTMIREFVPGFHGSWCAKFAGASGDFGPYTIEMCNEGKRVAACMRGHRSVSMQREYNFTPGL